MRRAPAHAQLPPPFLPLNRVGAVQCQTTESAARQEVAAAVGGYRR